MGLRSLGSFRAVSEQLTLPNEILRAETSCVKPICKDFSEDNFHKGDLTNDGFVVLLRLV